VLAKGMVSDAVVDLAVAVAWGKSEGEGGTLFNRQLLARGTIEIVSDVKVVTAGNRVGPSEATLLNMLNVSPFTYGMFVVQIFDSGNVFAPSVLDIDEQDLFNRFLTGIKTIAAISLALNYPTIVSVPHTLVNAYKNLISIALVINYSFEGDEKV
jgi:large subunit ribosomal protein LP0